jgi:DNA polymerase-3 subunit epsilon
MTTTNLQLRLDELDEPLRETTFVVVDLETTGGAAGRDRITEIGAVKVRGGEVLAEFATLVNPDTEIAAFVTVLTGITNSMVLGAPRMASVLPSFLEFSAGAVLVAHNAPFDIGFLKASCVAEGLPWPKPAVIDTVVLARRVLNRDEVPNCKLATLAGFFTARTTPNHRALADARATVEVLHGLLERLGALGVHSLPELQTFTTAVTRSQRRKRHLADSVPHAPGVYLFCDAAGVALYVGTSKDLRSRVRQYFMASEKRSRMAEMIGLTESVRHVVCAHPLEAQVRELRMITELKPRYNRRSKNSDRTIWLKLTHEAFPRLSVVRTMKADGGHYFGPVQSAAQAEQLRSAMHEALPIRQCTDRLVPGTRVRGACLLAALNRCLAPCEDRTDVLGYAELVDSLVQAWTSDPRQLIEPLSLRLATLSTELRYEEAALMRDRISSLVRSCARMQSLRSLSRIAELVAAKPDGDGGWELAVIRHGRLTGADHAARGVPPLPLVAALTATAEAVTLEPGTESAAMVEESEILLRWLAESGVRLVESSEPYYSPADGAAGLRSWLSTAGVRASPFADKRSLRTASRPTRSASA